MRIFISYRRDDSAGHAGRLFDTLRSSLRHPVFMDVEGVKGAQEFFAVIQREISRADLLIAVIGRNWVGTSDRSRSRRLDNPQDYVRREIELAFDAGIGVVPVLVGGASMPAERQLPTSLQELARINAVDLSDRRWESDTVGLISLLQRRGWEVDRAAPRRIDAYRAAELVGMVQVPGRVGDDDAGTILLGEDSILLTSPKQHRIWFIGIGERRVLGDVRMRLRRFWTPAAAINVGDYVWIADPFGRAVWSMQAYPGVQWVWHLGDGVDPDDGKEGTASLEYVRPSISRVRRIGIGAPVVDIGFREIREVSDGPDHGVWVVASEGFDRRTKQGWLLRIERGSRQIVARVSMPAPRRVAVGTDAVWVAAADVVAKIDPARNMISQVVPVGFEPQAIAVGEDTVWAAGRRSIARIDAPTAQLVGGLEVPEGYVECLTLGAGSLWAGALSWLHRIDPRLNEVVESRELREGMISYVRDIAIRRSLVCVAVDDMVEHRRYVALLHVPGGE